MLLHPTAITPLTSCLTPGVHFTLDTMGAQTLFLIWAQRTSVSADPASGERLKVGVFRFV
jgi:hypothetical protein